MLHNHLYTLQKANKKFIVYQNIHYLKKNLKFSENFIRILVFILILIPMIEKEEPKQMK